MIEERVYWLAWSQIPGIGSVLLKRIWQHFGNLQTAWTASKTALAEVEGLGNKLINSIIQARSQLNPPQFLRDHCQTNPHFWTPADEDYPQLLSEIPSPPPVLYYRGQVNPSENHGVTPLIGIVGTRNPTEHGRRWTRKISTALAKQGFTVVSGMASGIDGIAHEACLNAGGRTLAVLGTGVDTIYPQNHRQLYERIQQQGLILSEYPAKTKPDRGNFPARNRIIAGLCRAILVMEAPQQSGSLITARYANEFGRDVYSLPNSPEIDQAKGCLRLIHQGAALIVEIDELLSMLGAIPPMDTTQQLSLFETPSPIPNLEPKLLTVLQATSFEPTPFDRIVQTSLLASGEVSGILLQLELDGWVSQLPGMHYQRTR